MVVKRNQILLLIFFGLIFVLAILKYSSILSQAGSTPWQIYFAIFLLFIIILIFFYIQIKGLLPAGEAA